MSIALFAIIGSIIKAGPAYWIIYGMYVIWTCFKAIVKFFNAVSD